MFLRKVRRKKKNKNVRERKQESCLWYIFLHIWGDTRTGAKNICFTRDFLIPFKNRNRRHSYCFVVFAYSLPDINTSQWKILLKGVQCQLFLCLSSALNKVSKNHLVYNIFNGKPFKNCQKHLGRRESYDDEKRKKKKKTNTKNPFWP